MGRISTAGLVLAGIFASASALAETDEPRQLHRLQRLQAELKLSDQQKEEVRKIFDDARPQLEALRKQGQELRDKMRTRLKTVLTAEQMEKFENLQQERREKTRGRFGRHD